MSPPWTSRDRLSERHRIPARAGPSLPSRVRRGWVVTAPSPRHHIGPGRVVILPPSFSLPLTTEELTSLRVTPTQGCRIFGGHLTQEVVLSFRTIPGRSLSRSPLTDSAVPGVSCHYRVPGIGAGRLATRAGRRHCGA